MTNDIKVLKTSLLQSAQDFIATNNLPPESLMDTLQLCYRDENDDQTFMVAYTGTGILGRHPFGYVVELLDSGFVSLPVAPHCVLSFARNSVVEIMLQFSLFGLYFHEVKILAQTINNSLCMDGYVLKDGQVHITESSFLVEEPTVTLTYSEWYIKGKEEQFSYKLQITECNRFDESKKYIPIFKATAITEAMRKITEKRKTYSLAMQNS